MGHDAEEVRLDEWGHITTRQLPDGSKAGVMTRPGGARLVYSRNGDPSSGYDRVFWYDSVQGAIDALFSWAYPGKPEGFIRDCHANPVPWQD